MIRAPLTAEAGGGDLVIHSPSGQMVRFSDLDPTYAARLALAINRVPAPPVDPDFAEVLDDEVRVIAICIEAIMGLGTPVARNRVADYIVNRCAGMT